jgi:hypothetical protein
MVGVGAHKNTNRQKYPEALATRKTGQQTQILKAVAIEINQLIRT